ncbi:TPA: hypothetical protein DCX16_04465 [bacterium]|nr:hypothetical protein [bacterium]
MKEITQEELEKNLSLLSVLYSTAVWKITAKDEDEVFRIGLDRVTDFLKPDIATILVLEEGFLKIKAGMGLSKEVCSDIVVEVGQGTSGEVFLTGRPIAIYDLSKRDPSFIDPFIEGMDVKSIFCYPIKAEDNIIGVIWFGFLSGYEPSKEEEWLVALVAERISLMLQIHRLKITNSNE